MCWIHMNDVIVQNPIDSSQLPIKVASQWRGKSLSFSFSLLCFSASFVSSFTHSNYRINLPYPSLLLLSWSKSKVPHLVPPLFNSCALVRNIQIAILELPLGVVFKATRREMKQRRESLLLLFPFALFLFSVFYFPLSHLFFACMLKGCAAVLWCHSLYASSTSSMCGWCVSSASPPHSLVPPLHLLASALGKQMLTGARPAT